MTLAAQLSALGSPCDLMRLAGLDPAEVTSPAIACALDAMYATPKPTRVQLAIWKMIAPRRSLGFPARWPTERNRQVAAAVGRRGLKTSGLLSWTAAFELLCGGHEDFAAAGSRIIALIVAPRIDQARESVRGIRAALDVLAPLGVSFEQRDPSGSTELVIAAPASRVEKVVSIQAADAVGVRSFAFCFIGFDEAGFLPSESWLAQTGEDIARAAAPGTATFPNARVMYTSSLGPPAGIFHRLVEKTPSDCLVIRASTWAMNPRITKATCERLAGGDQATLDQEYGSTRWGYAGTTFISSGALKLDSPHCGKGPRQGSFVVIGDVGQLVDATALMVMSGFDHEVNPAHAPVRHVVVEHAESIEASRRDPIPIESIAAQLASLSRAYGDAPIVFDQFAAPTMKRELEKLGFTEHEDRATLPTERTFMQASMTATDQTVRWKLLRDLVHGGRLHLGPGHEELARQLAQLRATQLSSGALKVEGKRDDLADCAALGAELAARLPSTGGTSGTLQRITSGVHFDGQGVLRETNPRWIRVYADGRVEPAECPEWDPGFPEYANAMIARGCLTPSVQRFFDKQQADLAAKRAREEARNNGLNVGPVRG